MKSIILKLSILLFVFSSCSRNLTISKRHYRTGYYVSMQSKQNKELEKEKIIPSKNSLPTTISNKADKAVTRKDCKEKDRPNLYQESIGKKEEHITEEEATISEKEFSENASYELKKKPIDYAAIKPTQQTYNEWGNWLLILLAFLFILGLILFGLSFLVWTLIVLGFLIIICILILFIYCRINECGYKYG